MLNEVKRIWALARLTSIQHHLVAGLVSTDLFFVAAHVVLHLARDAGYRVDAVWLAFFSITSDDSPAEMIDSAKLTLIVGLLVFAYFRTKAPVFLAAATAFGYAMLDNLLMIHEQAAAATTGMFGPVILFGGLRWQDVAELAALGVPGLLFLIVLWSCAHKRSDCEIVFAFAFGGALVALGAFAAVVDCVHQVVEGYSIFIGKILSVVEDGGEMVILSLTVALALGAHRYADARGRMYLRAMDRYWLLRSVSVAGYREAAPWPPGHRIA